MRSIFLFYHQNARSSLLIPSPYRPLWMIFSMMIVFLTCSSCYPLTKGPSFPFPQLVFLSFGPLPPLLFCFFLPLRRGQAPGFFFTYLFCPLYIHSGFFSFDFLTAVSDFTAQDGSHRPFFCSFPRFLFQVSTFSPFPRMGRHFECPLSDEALSDVSLEY